MTQESSAAQVLLLERMMWPEVADAISSDLPILTPVGSLEQHGHHMPLGTDAFLPFELAKRVAKHQRLVIAPPLMYAGRSHPRSGGGGMAFAGTTGFPGSTLAGIFGQLTAEYLRQGFRRLVFLNGHFENADPLFEAAEHAIESFPDEAKVLIINWWELVTDEDIRRIFPGEFPGWELEHAGVVETSLMEHLLPEMVRPDRKTDGPPLRQRYDVVPLPSDRIPPTGVPYLSTPATPEIGRYLADALVERLAAIVADEFGPASSAHEQRAS